VSFTVTVTDSLMVTAHTSYILTIDPALVLGPSTLRVATVGNAFSTQLMAVGGSGTRYTFAAAGLPSWLKLSSSGLLSGTPTTATGSPFRFTVTATDSEGGTVTGIYFLSVNPALVIGPNTLPTATVNDTFSAQLNATGGTGTGYVFSSSGLPGWLSLSSGGLLIGTPPSGTGSPLRFTVTITDSDNATGDRTFTLTIR
jgi:hypothetical protein